MTDTQILTLTISITFPVLGFVITIAALMYSNKRMDDFRNDINTRFDDFERGLSTRFTDFEKRMDTRFDAFEKRFAQSIDNGFEHIGLLLKLHESEHHKP